MMSGQERNAWIEQFVEAISDDPDLELDVRIVLALRDEPFSIPAAREKKVLASIFSERPRQDSNLPHLA